MNIALEQEWFSYRISDFANELRQPVIGTNESVIIKDGTIKVLTNIALEFDELANTCLLVLHLEVSVFVSCHLLAIAKLFRCVPGARAMLSLSQRELIR